MMREHIPRGLGNIIMNKPPILFYSLHAYLEYDVIESWWVVRDECLLCNNPLKKKKPVLLNSLITIIQNKQGLNIPLKYAGVVLMIK